jgi:hypothetical protein
METREYSYKLHRVKKDGTPVEYDCIILYKTKRAKVVLTEEDVQMIKSKLSQKIPKKEICNQYGITYNKLKGILV